MRLRRSSLLLLIPLAALALRLSTPALANASYLLIACYALLGRAQAIQALGFSWFFSMVSSGIAPEATSASIGRYLVLAAAAFSVLLRSGMLVRSLSISRPVLTTLLLGLLLVVHSLLFSPVTDVSVLKAVSWTVAATTLLGAWSGMADEERERLSRQVFVALTIILVCSLPLVFLPLGYLRNGTGFQGVMSQPQAFGPTMALLGAWAGSRMLSSARPPWSQVLLFGLCVGMVLLSEARTAGLALGGGLFLAAVTGNALAQRSLKAFLPGLRSRRVHLVIALSVLAGLLAAPAIATRLGEFVSKRTENTGFADAYYQARGVLVERMWVNVKEHPWRGIGFGIASEPTEMIVEREPVLGLPTGASVEKGVLPVAVLEEVGVIGFVVVLLWIVMLVRRAARGGGMTALSVFFAALLLNLGEAVLFSPGGMGLLSLLLIGWATSERRQALPAPAPASAGMHPLQAGSRHA